MPVLASPVEVYDMSAEDSACCACLFAARLTYLDFVRGRFS